MSDGRSHKENAPSPGPICARPKLTRSARELRASASPPSATRASVSRATPPLPKAAPAPPLWPPAPEPASRPGPRLSSCSQPPRLQRRARAHSRPQADREVPGEPPGPAPTKAGSTPACESARGHGEPVPAASLVPAAEPLAARTPRQVGGPRLPAEKRGERAQRRLLTSISKSGRRNAVRKSEQKCAMAGTSHQERSSPSPVAPPSSGHISPPRSLARSDSGRGQRLSARGGSRRSA